MPEARSPSIDLRRRSAPLVVLVDNDEGLREALRFSLEIDGYQVTACRTGEQLVRLELPAAAACLVVDYKLAGVDGLEALGALRARGVMLPAILITSYASSAVRSRAGRVQANIIEKPLLGDALLARIHELAPLAP